MKTIMTFLTNCVNSLKIVPNNVVIKDPLFFAIEFLNLPLFLNFTVNQLVTL